jgi:omega-6 fatty acid desaturase (delta-12 desaturase)
MPDSRPEAVPAERSWRQLVAPFSQPDPVRGAMQVATTGLPFILIMALLFWGVANGHYLGLALTPIGAGLLVRLFAIQHDCGHGSFFRSRRANDGLGRIIGVLTLTPYEFWRRSHASHHATSGNLDRRGIGDVALLTVREYRALPGFARLRYRLYRHPVVMFGIGPTYQFLLAHRVAAGYSMRDRAVWGSVLGTNLVIAAILTLAGFTIGLGTFLLAYLPVAIGAASIGVWLFYVQHQFEEAYWATSADWSHRAAALDGCSFYDLPRLLHWATGSIGFHHIHHLSSKVPNYRLRACHDSHPDLRAAKRLTILESLRCARLALWDEDQRRMVPFGPAIWAGAR